MSPAARIAGALAAVVVTTGIVALSHVPIARSDPSAGLLRLAWRARPERIEQCREQSSEALAAVPAHMRQTRICEGRSASYRMEVHRNGQRLLARVVSAGGLRHDRPLYVFHEIPVPAGETSIRITFTRIEAPDPAPEDGGASAASRPAGDTNVTGRQELTEAIPASLIYERTVEVEPGQVRLISYDPARKVLYELAPYR